MRYLTKMEAMFMGLTPSRSATVSAVLQGVKVHPKYYRKGIASSVGILGMRRRDILEVLIGAKGKELGMPFRSKDISTGNDAPRGGATGDWIQLTASGKAKAKRLLA